MTNQPKPLTPQEAKHRTSQIAQLQIKELITELNNRLANGERNISYIHSLLPETIAYLIEDYEDAGWEVKYLPNTNSYGGVPCFVFKECRYAQNKPESRWQLLLRMLWSKRNSSGS